MNRIPIPKFGTSVVRKSKKGMAYSATDYAPGQYRVVRAAQKNAASRNKRRMRNANKADKRQYKLATAKERAAVQKSAIRSGAATSTTSSATYSASDVAKTESAARARNSDLIVNQADGGIGSGDKEPTPSTYGSGPDTTSGDAVFVSRR